MAAIRVRARWRRGAGRLVVAPLFGLALLLVADGSAAASTRIAADQMVSAQDNVFVPATVFVNVGDTVTWINDGLNLHTTTADDATWDSGDLNPGDFFAVTFTVAGTFPYHCAHHAFLGMNGSVVVSDAPAGTAPKSVVLRRS